MLLLHCCKLPSAIYELNFGLIFGFWRCSPLKFFPTLAGLWLVWLVATDAECPMGCCCLKIVLGETLVNQPRTTQPIVFRFKHLVSTVLIPHLAVGNLSSWNCKRALKIFRMGMVPFLACIRFWSMTQLSGVPCFIQGAYCNGLAKRLLGSSTSQP